MKFRNFLSFILIFILIVCQSAYAAPKADFSVSSESVVLIDASSGQAIYSKNPQKVQYPAGLTKIMAALVIIENGNLDELVTIEQSVIDTVSNTNNLGLVPGEVLTIRELLYGMLLQSYNDCAVSAATKIFGSTDALVKKMNEKAAELGATNTHFSNVTGIFNKENYTTAEDLALIMNYASGEPVFMEIAGAKSYVLPMNTKVLYERTLVSKCNLLSSYEGVTSGLYGYTDEGKYTAVATAGKNGFNVICVSMNCEGEEERQNDIKKLLDFAFNNYHTITISPEDVRIHLPNAKLKGLLGKTGEVNFSLPEAVMITVPIDATVQNLTYTPNIQKGYKKASSYNATVDVSFENEKITDLTLNGTAVKKITFYNIIKTIFTIILVLILLFIALCAYYIIDSERKKKKRRQDKMKRTLRVKKDI